MAKKQLVAGPTPLTPKTEPVDETTVNRPFTPTANAYVAVLNEETKRYDMVTVEIDLVTNETRVSREQQRYDSPHRGMQDTIKRITDYFIKGKK